MPLSHGTPPEELDFCGDRLEVSRDAAGRVRGRVGGEAPQTPATYRKHVPVKFPGDYYDKLEGYFRRVFSLYTPEQVNSRLVYRLYDEWKKSCGVGRLVDLDRLIAWCGKRAAAP
jgi:hypothetical protein